MGEPPVEESVDLASLVLDVYESREGWWHPEHGQVETPQGWAFLPSGEAFVTRTVKAAGVFWVAWAPRSRSRREARYQDELTAAIVTYLAFAPEHHALAQTIAKDAAERAARVGSGRVGRTRTLTLEERAALAAQAQLRHAYTDYEQRLVAGSLADDDDALYRQIKAAAHDQVDDFLTAHRKTPTSGD